MKRWMIVLGLSAVLGALPVGAQETVIGFFDGPPNGDSGTGALPVTGWALADSGVKRVTLQVDGEDISQFVYGRPRPLVTDLYPGFPDSPGPGFGLFMNTTDFTNGRHRVTAKVLTNAGNEVILDGIHSINFVNNTSILAPFGKIDFPQRNADLYGDCDGNSQDLDPRIPVTGWALDLGVETGDAGIAWTELLLDGSILYSTRIDCTFATGLGLHNCYGFPRLDVERSYPFAKDAPTAGFRFLLDVGALIQAGWVRGFHTLTIRSGDLSTQTANVDEIPVNFWCFGDRPGDPASAGVLGFIESPREGRQYSVDGNILFQGWAVARGTVSSVEIWVDGDFFGNAAYGVDSRPGVISSFPGWPNVNRPVWRLELPASSFAEGFRQVEVIVVDTQGERTLIGERTFFVNTRVD